MKKTPDPFYAPRKGEHDEAIKCLRKFVELRPRNPDARKNLGNALRRAGKPTQAVTAYRMAVEINPKDADAYNNLGAALQESGRVPEAEEVLRTCLSIKPDHSDAHWNRGLALLAMGQWREGWMEYEWRQHLKEDVGQRRTGKADRREYLHAKSERRWRCGLKRSVEGNQRGFGGGEDDGRGSCNKDWSSRAGRAEFWKQQPLAGQRVRRDLMEISGGRRATFFARMGRNVARGKGVGIAQGDRGTGVTCICGDGPLRRGRRSRLSESVSGDIRVPRTDSSPLGEGEYAPALADLRQAGMPAPPSEV